MLFFILARMEDIVALEAQRTHKMEENRLTLRKILLIISGFFFVGLAALGLFLPLLPTTPFLLVAAACFIRSSRRLYLWLINHRVFGAYIRNYLRYKAITPKAKIISILLIWITISYSALCVIENIPLRIVLFLLALSMSLRILLYKTLTKEMMMNSENGTNRDF
jgi:uncharacterized protein